MLRVAGTTFYHSRFPSYDVSISSKKAGHITRVLPPARVRNTAAVQRAAAARVCFQTARCVGAAELRPARPRRGRGWGLAQRLVMSADMSFDWVDIPGHLRLHKMHCFLFLWDIGSFWQDLIWFRFVHSGICVRLRALFVYICSAAQLQADTYEIWGLQPKILFWQQVSYVRYIQLKLKLRSRGIRWKLHIEFHVTFTAVISVVWAL